MGMTGIVLSHKALQAALKVLGTGKAPTGQKAPLHDTKEQLGLIEPRAMFRREMKNMAVAWIAQKGLALRALFEFVGLKRYLTPACHQAADVETPVGVEVVQHPLILLHVRQALVHVLKMGHEIGGRAGAPDGPGNLARRHHQRVDQDARAVADVLMFTPFTSPWLRRFGGGLTLQDLHASFLIAAEHQATLGVGVERFGIQLADSVGFGIKIRIVAVEPIRTLVGLEIDVVQDTPDTRAANRVGVQRVEQGGDNFI
jgi:hypothetical protein